MKWTIEEGVETTTETLEELTNHFKTTPPKGEIVICVAGNE